MIISYIILLMVCIIGMFIIGFCAEYIYEFFTYSKFILFLFISVIIILCYSSIHFHDCYRDRIPLCEQAHKLHLTYNYCLNTTTQPSDDDLKFDYLCMINPKEKCKTIPYGCGTKKEYIDGICIPFTKWCVVLI